jgi:hypothetical protein
MLTWAAMLANLEGNPGEAAARAREAYEFYRDAGDPSGLALCEAILGLAVALCGEAGQAGELLAAARARFGRVGDDWGTGIATLLHGFATSFTAQPERGPALARESLAGFRAAGGRLRTRAGAVPRGPDLLPATPHDTDAVLHAGVPGLRGGTPR